MNEIDILNSQGLLAKAAYAVINAGITLSDALENIGMTHNQATAFAASWSVVDQYTDASGASATVFRENATGKNYLAIRGTEITAGDINSDYILALGFPSYLNPQFIELKTQVENWINDGTV